ncbi:MAG: hypothetical protein ACI837_002084, partial [Crocinitomicaceae bacterium]
MQMVDQLLEQITNDFPITFWHSEIEDMCNRRG